MTAAPRAFIIGCGRIAGGYQSPDSDAVLTHAAAYRRLGARLAGCCDVDKTRAADFAKQWSAEQSGSDLTALLEQTQPEVVSICTPPEVRVSVLEPVLRNSSVRAVLVEKPVARNAREASQVLKLARRHPNVPVLVNFFRAFDPFYRELERRHERNTLREVTARYTGSALSNASHLLERLLAMCGDPATVRRLSGARETPLIELSFGATRALVLPTTGTQYSMCELDLLYERLRVRVVDGERRVEVFASQPDPLYPGYFVLAPQRDWIALAPSHESILYAVQATIAAARGTTPDSALLERAVAVAKILDEVGAS